MKQLLVLLKAVGRVLRKSPKVKQLLVLPESVVSVLRYSPKVKQSPKE